MGEPAPSDGDSALGTDFASNSSRADDQALRANRTFAAAAGHPRRLLVVTIAKVQALFSRLNWFGNRYKLGAAGATEFGPRFICGSAFTASGRLHILHD